MDFNETRLYTIDKLKNSLDDFLNDEVDLKEKEILDYINIINPKSGETYLEVKNEYPELLNDLNINNNYIDIENNFCVKINNNEININNLLLNYNLVFKDGLLNKLSKFYSETDLKYNDSMYSLKEYINDESVINLYYKTRPSKKCWLEKDKEGTLFYSIDMKNRIKIDFKMIDGKYKHGKIAFLSDNFYFHILRIDKKEIISFKYFEDEYFLPEEETNRIIVLLYFLESMFSDLTFYISENKYSKEMLINSLNSTFFEFNKILMDTFINSKEFLEAKKEL